MIELVLVIAFGIFGAMHPLWLSMAEDHLWDKKWTYRFAVFMIFAFPLVGLAAVMLHTMGALIR